MKDLMRNNFLSKHNYNFYHFKPSLLNSVDSSVADLFPVIICSSLGIIYGPFVFGIFGIFSSHQIWRCPCGVFGFTCVMVIRWCISVLLLLYLGSTKFWVDDFYHLFFSFLFYRFFLNVSKERVLYKHGVLTKFTWHHVHFLAFLCFGIFMIRLFLVLLFLEFLEFFHPIKYEDIRVSRPFHAFPMGVGGCNYTTWKGVKKEVSSAIFCDPRSKVKVAKFKKVKFSCVHDNSSLDCRIFTKFGAHVLWTMVQSWLDLGGR